MKRSRLLLLSTGLLAVTAAAQTPNWAKLDAYLPFKTAQTLSIGKETPPVDRPIPGGGTVDNNKATQYIQKTVNVNVKAAWQAPPNGYSDKLNLSIASGDIPDAVIVTSAQLARLVDAGALADLTPYIPKYLSPQLKAYYRASNNEALKAATFSGKVMALPNVNVGGDAVDWLWIRQDWLDKLKLKTPRTLADVQAVAQAFMDKDPDGNGKNDTGGIAAKSDIYSLGNDVVGLRAVFNTLSSFPQVWQKDASGKVFYGSVAPQTKEALTLLNSWYKSGLLDREFATTNQDKAVQAITAGRTGLFFGPWWMSYYPLTDSLKLQPNARWNLVPIRSADGKFRSSHTEVSSSFLAVKKGYANPEAAIKVMNVEVDLMRQFNGAPQVYPNLNEIWGSVMPFGMTLDYYDAVQRRGKLINDVFANKVKPSALNAEETKDYQTCLNDQKKPYGNLDDWANCFARRVASLAMVKNPATGPTPLPEASRVVTTDNSWPTLTKLESQAMLQFITGAKPLSQWDDFVKQWNQQGGAAITAKVQAAVDKD